MRELSRLEPAATATPVRQKAWGLRQGLMFLGSVFVGIGVIAGSYFSLVAMPAPQEVDIPQVWLDGLPPAGAWQLWSNFRHGMPRKPDDVLASLVVQRDRAQRGVHFAWMVIALGGMIAASGFLVRRSRLRPSTV